MSHPLVRIALDDQVRSDLNDFLKFYGHANTGHVPPDPDILDGTKAQRRLAVVMALGFAAGCSRSAMNRVDDPDDPEYMPPIAEQLMHKGKLPYGMHIIDPQKAKERRAQRVRRRLGRL